MQTATNPQTGEKLVLQNGQWVPAAQAAPAPMGGPVPGPMTFGTPKPKTPAPQTPDQASYDKSNAEYKDYQTRSQPVYDRATAIDKVRDGYRQDKRVLKYEEAEPVYISALDSPGNPAGDMILVNAMAKVTDPATGVQARESQGYENAQPQLDQLKAQLLKQFGDDGYGNFTPEGRAKMREALTGRMRKLADQYRLARKDHADYIKSLNLPNTDPETVIGPFAGLPYQQAEEAYQGRGLRLGGKQVTPGPGQQVIDPAGTGDIGFNAPDQNKNPLSDQQQAAYNLFFQTHPNATADQVRAFGVSIGADINNADDIIKARDAGAGVQPGSEAVLKPRESIQKRADQRVANASGVLDAAALGAVDAPSMGAFDELSAAGDAVGDMFRGEQGGLGQLYDENLIANRQFIGSVKDRHPYAYLGGALGGSLALPSFGARTPSQLAAVGGGYGGAYGFGSGEGGFGNRAMNALGGAAAGSALGYAIPKTLNLAGQGAASLGRRIVGPSTPEQQALLRAGDQEQVPVNMLDVFPGTRNTGATLETIPGASGTINKGVAAGRDAMEARVAQLGAGGTARREGMGERAFKAGERAIDSHRAQSRADYGIAEKLGGTVKAEPVKAAAAVRSILGDLSETENINRSTIGIYKDILADFLDKGGNLKPLSIGAIKNLRRQVRREMNNRGLVGSKEDTELQSVIDAASEDMFDALNRHNPNAAKAYRVADEGFSQRMSYIKDTLQKVMGTREKPVSGEALMAKLRGMAGSGSRGDSRQLAQFWRSLNNEEKADMAATFAEGLGRRSPSEAFSPQTFLTQIRSFDDRARIVIFGRQGARSIQNLAKLAEAKKGTVERMNNSRSGSVVNYRSVLSSLLFGVPGGAAIAGAAQQDMGGGAIAGGGLALAVTLGSRGMAKGLMNEQFTRLLANAPPTTSPAVINAHVGKMRQLAAKNPDLRALVEQIEKGLLRAANDNLGKSGQLAASPNERPEQEK